MLNSPGELSKILKSAAADAGFGLCGIAEVDTPETLRHFDEWLDAGMHGEMAYMHRRRDAVADPEMVLSDAKSVVIVALDYRTQEPAASQPGYGRISRYAWGRADYHSIIRRKLKTLAATLHVASPGCRTRGVVDTAPLLERDFARKAGLGWFGKNTMLISKHRGSFFFLGALLTDAVLEPDAPHETDHCGTCTACLDACPTRAFPEPGVLDARRCISYLTIELRGQPIPDEFHGQTDDWVFGCDVCQDVCPWNSKSVLSDEPSFRWRDRAIPPGLIPLDDITAMTESEFQDRFAGTPLERTGLEALQRNAAIQSSRGSEDDSA